MLRKTPGKTDKEIIESFIAGANPSKANPRIFSDINAIKKNNLTQDTKDDINAIAKEIQADFRQQISALKSQLNVEFNPLPKDQQKRDEFIAGIAQIYQNIHTKYQLNNWQFPSGIENDVQSNIKLNFMVAVFPREDAATLYLLNEMTKYYQKDDPVQAFKDGTLDRIEKGAEGIQDKMKQNLGAEFVNEITKPAPSYNPMQKVLEDLNNKTNLIKKGFTNVNQDYYQAVSKAHNLSHSNVLTKQEKKQLAKALERSDKLLDKHQKQQVKLFDKDEKNIIKMTSGLLKQKQKFEKNKRIQESKIAKLNVAVAKKPSKRKSAKIIEINSRLAVSNANIKNLDSIIAFNKMNLEKNQKTKEKLLNDVGAAKLGFYQTAAQKAAPIIQKPVEIKQQTPLPKREQKDPTPPVTAPPVTAPIVESTPKVESVAPPPVEQIIDSQYQYSVIQNNQHGRGLAYGGYLEVPDVLEQNMLYLERPDNKENIYYYMMVDGRPCAGLIEKEEFRQVVGVDPDFNDPKFVTAYASQIAEKLGDHIEKINLAKQWSLDESSNSQAKLTDVQQSDLINKLKAAVPEASPPPPPPPPEEQHDTKHMFEVLNKSSDSKKIIESIVKPTPVVKENPPQDKPQVDSTIADKLKAMRKDIDDDNKKDEWDDKETDHPKLR